MSIQWEEINSQGSLPDEEGSYLCAFSDGSVEAFYIDVDILAAGGWRNLSCKLTHWADLPKHPGDPLVQIATEERQYELDQREAQRSISRGDY